MIDDSVADLGVLTEMISRRTWRLSHAFDGISGCRQALVQHPRLILLDVRMPGQDGFTTCRQLKADPATHDIPVIFLTASNDLGERLTGFSLGAVDYIGKPFAEEEVIARIGVHLLPARASSPSSPSSPSLGDRIAATLTQEDQLVRRGQDILRHRLAQPPNLDELANILGTNRTQLNRAFQSVCGQPVFGWLREERLRLARYQVDRTDIPIVLIGERLGYSTQANFTKAFRDRFGIPPGEMRGLARTGRGGAAPVGFERKPDVSLPKS